MRIFRTISSIAILSASIALMSLPAKADFTKQYGTVGAWRIFGSDTHRDSCAADRDNQNVTLRIIHTEYTGDWFIGNPYYNDRGHFTGGFGFSRVPQETLDFNTYTHKGWAMHQLAADYVRELRVASKVVLDLDRGPQVFPLDNSSLAMDMLLECVRNKGVKQQQNYVQQQPQRHQNNQRPVPQNEQFYANVRGWRVDSSTNPSGLFFCVAGKTAGGQIMRVGFDGSRWAIGMPTNRTGNMLGELYIEVNHGAVIHGGQMTYTHYPDGWATTELNYANVEHLKRGSSVSISIDNNGFSKFSLSGSTAAMLKVEECVRYRGVKPRRQVQQQAPSNRNNQVAPRRQQTQNYNNNVPLKSKLTGIWVWADANRNRQQNKIVSTIELLGNNQARYCYGFPCWDVYYQLHADNSISFSHDGVAHFEFWETGPNRISGRYWDNGNSRGRPDATVNMR